MVNLFEAKNDDFTFLADMCSSSSTICTVCARVCDLSDSQELYFEDKWFLM